MGKRSASGSDLYQSRESTESGQQAGYSQQCSASTSPTTAACRRLEAETRRARRGRVRATDASQQPRCYVKYRSQTGTLTGLSMGGGVEEIELRLVCELARESESLALSVSLHPLAMSAPPAQSAQQGQAKRRRPNRGPRKPKAPGAAAPNGTATATPPHLQQQQQGAATPLSLASTVTTPSQTPRAATPIPGSALSKTFSSVRFSDFVQQGLISQATARGIAQGGYEYCTEVQAQTLPVCLTGVDVCVSPPSPPPRSPLVAPSSMWGVC